MGTSPIRYVPVTINMKCNCSMILTDKIKNNIRITNKRITNSGQQMTLFSYSFYFLISLTYIICYLRFFLISEKRSHVMSLSYFFSIQIVILYPSASKTFSRKVIDGFFVFPDSNFPMTACETSKRSASSCCVRFSAFLNLIISS